MVIKGEKVELHPYEDRLNQLIFDWHKDESFDDFMSDERGPKCAKDLTAMYSRFMAPFGRLFVAVVQGKPIGIVALGSIDMKNRKAEIFGGIGSSVDRKKGHGVEAFGLMMKWAYEQLALHKVYAYVKEHNKLAINTLKKCGMTDNVLKDDTFQDGKFINVHLMYYIFDRKRGKRGFPWEARQHQQPSESEQAQT